MTTGYRAKLTYLADPRGLVRTFRVTFDGEAIRRGIAEAARAGRYLILDPVTGQEYRPRPAVPVNWRQEGF